MLFRDSPLPAVCALRVQARFNFSAPGAALAIGLYRWLPVLAQRLFAKAFDTKIVIGIGT